MKKKMLKMILGLIVALSILTNCPNKVFADEAPELKKVRVSSGMNNALYLDKDGKAQGLCADYIAMLSYLNNWDIEYVDGSWNESVQNLYDGKIDILLPTQMTEDRKDTMLFSEYIGGYQPIVLVTKRNASIYYEDYESMNHKRVAVSSDSSNEEAVKKFMSQHEISFDLIEINTVEEKLNALEQGDVDILAFSTFNEVPDGKVVAILEYLPFYYCTSIENQELMDEINYGMMQIMAIKPNMVTEVFGYVLIGPNPNAYTKAENDTIEHTESIRIGLYDDTLPLEGVDADGNPSGIFVDLLKRLEEKIGIKVEYYFVPQDKFLYDYLDDHTVDFVISTRNLPYLADDVSKYMVTENLMDYVTVAITMPDYEFVDGTNPGIVLTKSRKYLENDLLMSYPGAHIQYVNSARECLIALQERKADITYLNSWEFNYQLKNPRFQHMIQWDSISKTSPVVLGALRTTDAQLLSVVDKAVTEIATENKDGIITANLNMPYGKLSFADQLYSMRTSLFVFAFILFIVLLAFCVYIYMRRKYVQELQKSNHDLFVANDAKTNFLSRMSHELRTPLNAIEGYATIMEQNLESKVIDKENEKKNLRLIKRANKYLLAIISDLLDIQKLEKGQIELALEEIDSELFMDTIVDIMKPEAETKHIDFTYQRKTKTSEAFLVDPVRLQQVLLNLLYNAIKFTPDYGKVILSAEAIAVDEKYTTMKFQVEDSGIGMSKEFMDANLYHLFSQENHGTKSPYSGCGTGLAICQDLVTMMGGTISCESEQGKGTIFTVILKIEHVQKRRRTRVKNYETYHLQGIRVLLCEDNEMNQDMEKKLLERMDCEVDIADNGYIGLEKFKESEEKHYDVILMDIRMPEMDGIEATKAIRALNRVDAKEVPILAVSANAFEEDVKLSLNAGMNEHLAKPVDAKVLYEKISKYCLNHA